MVAFRASRLVWLAMFWISVTTSPIFCVPLASPSTTELVRRASSAALPAISAERVTCLAISLIDAVSSSVAAATVSTFAEACVDAEAAAVVCRVVASLLPLIDEDSPWISLAATATASTIRPMLRSKPEASSRLAASRSCFARPSASVRSALARASAALAASASAVFSAVVSNSCDSLWASADQHARFDDENDGVKHDAAEIGRRRDRSPPEG